MLTVVAVMTLSICVYTYTCKDKNTLESWEHVAEQGGSELTLQLQLSILVK